MVSFWIQPETFGGAREVGERTDFQGRILDKGSRFKVSIANTLDGSSVEKTMVFGELKAASGSPETITAIAPNGMIELNTWQHYVVTYRNGEVAFYKNGFQVAPPEPASLGRTAESNLVIGNTNTPAKQSVAYEGVLDELGIWGRCLTEPEILNLAGLSSKGPPHILKGPEPKSQLIGTTARLSVHAEGKRPISYQWLFNGKPITGANDSILVLKAVTPDKSGTYRVRIENEEGEVTTDSVKVGVDSGVLYQNTE